MSTQRLGLTVIPGAGWRASDVRTVAREAEAAGFDAIFTTEVNNDALATAQLMGSATTHIQIGTWIASIYLRHSYTCEGCQPRSSRPEGPVRWQRQRGQGALQQRRVGHERGRGQDPGGHRRHPGRHRLSMTGRQQARPTGGSERAYPGHVEEDVMAQEAAAKNSGRKARPAAAKPVSQTVQDALRRLAVVEHMTYPAEVNGQMNVRLEGIMSARQLEALRKWLA